jgi:hypothetical protein
MWNQLWFLVHDKLVFSCWFQGYLLVSGFSYLQYAVSMWISTFKPRGLIN